jgi:hypothetical protein
LISSNDANYINNNNKKEEEKSFYFDKEILNVYFLPRVATGYKNCVTRCLKCMTVKEMSFVNIFIISFSFQILF